MRVGFRASAFLVLSLLLSVSTVHALRLEERDVQSTEPNNFCLSVEEMAFALGASSEDTEACLSDAGCAEELSALSSTTCGDETSPVEKIKKLLDDLYEKWKVLPSCSLFGHSKNEVWGKLKDWLKKIGFPGSYPGVISPDKKEVDKFLKELEDFLKTKKYGDVQDLIDRLKDLFSDDPAILQILKDLEKLIKDNKDGVIPLDVIEKLKEIIRKLIMGDTATASSAKSGQAVGLACMYMS